MKKYFKKIITGIKTLMLIIKNSCFLRFKKNINLNIGAGSSKLKGYINVDSLFLKNTELISKIENLHFFIRKGNVSKIYASHILEHFSQAEVKKIIKLLYNLLNKNGELRISVPDIDKIVKIYKKNWDHFQTKGNAPWNGLIYGGQSSKYDFHKTGFNFNWLKYLLKEAGFKKVEEYNAEKFCIENNIKDSSLAHEPFNEPISLNVIAIK
jgi:predicted SAM-dependent methyltransferase